MNLKIKMYFFAKNHVVKDWQRRGKGEKVCDFSPLNLYEISIIPLAQSVLVS